MTTYDLKHEGAEIDEAVSAVESGSVVTDNTVSSIAPGEAKPASADAIAKELIKKVDKVKGKGLSSNDYTDSEMAMVAKNTSDIAKNAEDIAKNAEDIAKNAEDIAKNTSDIAKNAEDIAKNAEGIAKKANPTEYYPAMAVGIADNLRGRGEATEEYFTYRPSAGASNSISEEGVATMKRIKGNSIVWNNLSASIPEMAAYRTNIYDFDGVNTFTVKADNPSNNLALDVTLNKRFSVLNHYYLFMVEGSTVNDIAVAAGSNYPKLSDGWAIVQCTTANKNFYIYPLGLNKDIVAGTTFTLDSVKLIDLTKMFGAGNEPTTIEEFYARIPEGVDINAYNEGELISMNATAIETTGFNQWDEEWELGRINVDTGKLINSTTAIRSKNFIPVIGGETYNFYCKKTGITLFFRVATYDANQKYIGYIPSGIYPSTSTTDANFNNPTTFDKDVAYIKFDVADQYGAVYNNDICINLSHSGVRDGEYEPYKEFTHDLSWIKRYFPDGMKSAGSVYDEITETEAIQRIGEVDLGSLDWQININGEIVATLDTAKRPAQGLCLKYNFEKTNSGSAENDKSFVLNTNAYNLRILDSDYTDVESFKSAMSGVKLYYELAEPIVTPIPARAINLNYPVWDWGTERAVSDVPSAPFRADIIYGFNAVDTIRTNKLNIEDILRRLAELEAKTVVEQSVEE